MLIIIKKLKLNKMQTKNKNESFSIKNIFLDDRVNYKLRD